MDDQLKVMVVDDDQRMVKTICDILSIKGYEWIAAYSGEEALQKLKTDNPGCVVMDVKMPGIDGVEALQAMKEINPALPIILMSAYASNEQEAEAELRGAYAVLPKPIDIQGLLSFLSLLRKEDTILIVDDDHLFCDTLKDLLQVRGYRVRTDLDGAGVLEQMEKEYVLSVVLDIKLGDEDGLDVLRKIREKYPTKPVVLVTGYREEAGNAVEKGLRVGAYTCLYKPFATEELIRIIREIDRMKLQAALHGSMLRAS